MVFWGAGNSRHRGRLTAGSSVNRYKLGCGEHGQYRTALTSKTQRLDAARARWSRRKEATHSRTHASTSAELLPPVSRSRSAPVGRFATQLDTSSPLSPMRSMQPAQISCLVRG